MDIETFWQLIARTKDASNGDGEKQAELLIEELVAMTEADILSYHQLLYEQFDRAYSWDLWAAAYIMNGGCGNDGFVDFRAWLIGQGQVTFEKALADPETLLDATDLAYSTQVEALGYVTFHAYERKTGHEIPFMRHDRPPLSGTKWEETSEALQQKYPKLYAKFWDMPREF